MITKDELHKLIDEADPESLALIGKACYERAYSGFIGFTYTLTFNVNAKTSDEDIERQNHED